MENVINKANGIAGNTQSSQSRKKHRVEMNTFLPIAYNSYTIAVSPASLMTVKASRLDDSLVTNISIATMLMLLLLPLLSGTNTIIIVQQVWSF